MRLASRSFSSSVNLTSGVYVSSKSSSEGALDLADQPHDDDADLLADTAVDKVLYRLDAPPSSADACLQRGLVREARGDIAGAKRDYRAALKAARAAGCKPDRQACHALGCVLGAAGDLAPAAQQLRKACSPSLVAESSDDQAWRSASASLQKAVVLRELGEVRCIHASIADSPALVLLQLTLMLPRGRGRIQPGAQEAYDEALALDPAHAGPGSSPLEDLASLRRRRARSGGAALGGGGPV